MKIKTAFLVSLFFMGLCLSASAQSKGVKKAKEVKAGQKITPFIGKSQNESILQKLTNIKEYASLDEIVSTFGKDFEIRREPWWGDEVYELYYSKEGFGIAMGKPYGEAKLMFSSVIIYPSKFAYKQFKSIPIHPNIKLKDVKLKNATVNLGYMGSVVRPIVGSGMQNLGKYGKHAVEYYMQLFSSDIFPSICGDYTELNPPDCQYRIVLVDGKMNSIEKRLRGFSFYRPAVSRKSDSWAMHNKIINTKLTGPIDRIIIAPAIDDDIPPKVLEELTKPQ